MNSEAHVLLEIHLKELGFHDFVPEFKFHPKRKWRFDYLLGKPMGAWGDVAIEIEGGIHVRGRHTRGKGFEADLEKYNAAARIGYKVLRFSTGQVLSGAARAFLASWRNEVAGTDCTTL